MMFINYPPHEDSKAFKEACRLFYKSERKKWWQRVIFFLKRKVLYKFILLFKKERNIIHKAIRVSGEILSFELIQQIFIEDSKPTPQNTEVQQSVQLQKE